MTGTERSQRTVTLTPAFISDKLQIRAVDGQLTMTHRHRSYRQHAQWASPRHLLYTISVLACFMSACNRSNPVDAVSVRDSGVTIRDIDLTLTEDDWGGWRGPMGNGIARSQKIVTTWNETDNVLWRVDLPGRGHSSPTIVGDTVFVTTAIESLEEHMVLGFDRLHGAELWRTVIHRGGMPSSHEVHAKASNANGTLASDGQRLYIAMWSSNTVIATALDLHGKIVWQQEVGKFTSKFGYAPSPVIYKSLVIFAAEHSQGGYLVALDGTTGNLAWRVPRGTHGSYSSPSIATVGGCDQLLISGGDMLSSYDPKTGDALWSTPAIASATCGTAVTTDERIFASGGYPEKETVCVSARGEKLWSTSDKIYEPSLLVVGNRLIGITDNGIAHCWDIQTGDRHWRKRLGGKFSASPILVGEIVIAPNLEGETFLFRASDEYEQISVNQLGNDCYASPAVSRGKLFLRAGVGKGTERKEQLICIGKTSLP